MSGWGKPEPARWAIGRLTPEAEVDLETTSEVANAECKGCVGGGGSNPAAMYENRPGENEIFVKMWFHEKKILIILKIEISIQKNFIVKLISRKNENRPGGADPVAAAAAAAG